MGVYGDLNSAELAAELDAQRQRYDSFKARGLKLNMARGKPAPNQLDLSMRLLDAVPANVDPELLEAGAAGDLRNYGGAVGLDAARELMGAILGAPAANTLVMGNASLNIMYDTVARAMTFGILGSEPWARQLASVGGAGVKFLCPVPGYDRHFAVTEHFGIEMVPVAMTADGPDMSAVEQLAQSDASVKGIWCVPKYANPTGVTYSDETVRRFAALKPAASDFRIFWDNAYAVHDLVQPGDQLLDLASAARKAGNEDIYYLFGSTSKITFAGAGIAAIAASDANIAEIKAHLAFQTIGPDKINQLRHVQFLHDLEGVRAHMQKHTAIVKPKFDIVVETLERELGGLGIGTWTNPSGGYFISFDGLPDTAKRTVALAKEAGVVLTGAGATYPYGSDPQDRNIRIAPTYPSVNELATAAELFAICVRIAALEAMETPG
jgi:aspartate/methionine/tyrosine aminotransferase